MHTHTFILLVNKTQKEGVVTIAFFVEPDLDQLTALSEFLCANYMCKDRHGCSKEGTQQS